MSKQSAIRWRQIDEEKARKAIKRYNNKIDYQKRAHPERADALPPRLSMKKLKKEVLTREDFNRKMKSIEAWSKKGAEKIVTNVQGERATIWRIEETKKAVKRINRQREKEHKEINAAPVYVDGKPVKTVERAAEIQTKKPINYSFQKSKKGEFEKFAEWAERESMKGKKLYEDNAFLNTLETVVYSSFSGANADKFVQLMRKVGGAKLWELYKLGYEEVNPTWIYLDPTDEDEKVNMIVELLTPYAN